MDSTRKKRLVTIGAAVAVTVGCLGILILYPSFWSCRPSQALTGIVGAVIPPAISVAVIVAQAVMAPVRP